MKWHVLWWHDIFVSLATMSQQTSQKFLWVILYDSTLLPPVLGVLRAMLDPFPNYVLVEMERGEYEGNEFMISYMNKYLPTISLSQPWMTSNAPSHLLYTILGPSYLSYYWVDWVDWLIRFWRWSISFFHPKLANHLCSNPLHHSWIQISILLLQKLWDLFILLIWFWLVD